MVESIAKLTSAFIKTALQFDKADFNEKEENIKQNGGQNKQTILLTIKYKTKYSYNFTKLYCMYRSSFHNPL